MPNVALIPRAETRIEPLTAVVDGYPDALHRLETATGGEPLEDGRQITDHAVALEDRVTLTGWVSDFGGADRPANAWDAIRRLHRELEPVDLTTELGIYKEMLIKRVETHHTARGIRFTLTMQQILRVGVTESTLPPDAVADGPAEGRAGEIERGRVALTENL